MQHFQVNSSTGETKNYQNPAFHRNGVGVGKNGSKDVSLAVGDRRQNGFDQVGLVVFAGGETFLIESEASGTRFLHLNNHHLDARDVEF